MACEHKQLICSRKFSDIATSIVSGRLTIMSTKKACLTCTCTRAVALTPSPKKLSYIFFAGCMEVKPYQEDNYQEI